MSNAFSKLIRATARELAAKSSESVDWFKDSVEDLQKKQQRSDPNKIFKKFSFPQIGGMYLYLYDPKTKDKLPFYDMYPLVMPIEMYTDGFLGLNLHYLPPLARISLLKALIDIDEGYKYKNNQKLSVSYELLRRYANQFKGSDACVKRYLFSHVRSSFFQVENVDWEKAALLPLQRWKINTNKKYSGYPPY